MYEKGQGCTIDHVKAVQYYQLAADQGDAHGQCSIGTHLAFLSFFL